MSVLAALLLALSLEPAEVLSVRSEVRDERAQLRVTTVGDLPAMAVRRQGAELVVRLEATLPADLTTPAAVGPIESIRLSRDGAQLELRLVVAADQPYELRREASSVALLFGERPPAGQEGPESIRHLYAQLFPLGWSATAPTADAEESALATTDLPEDDDSWLLGLIRLQPGLALSYVDADTTPFQTPEPVRDSYFQVEPRLGVEFLPYENKYLQVEYAPRFRTGSKFDVVETTTHLVTARAELPVGTFSIFRGSFRYVTGYLETIEVDPGREYFFGLDRFTRKLYGVGARFKRSSRFDLDLSAGLNQIEASSQQYFDYETRIASAAIGYELDPNYRAAVGYSYEHLPTPVDRPEAEFTAHSAHLTLTGDIFPLVTGEATVGFKAQDNPNAAEGGRSFRGLVLRGSLTKEFSPASRMTLRFVRSPNPSAYQANGFYVTTAGQADLTVPLPLYFSLRGAVGYHVNDYRVVVPELGEPREDRIFAWSVGLGRSVTRWAFLRADYRHERRRSNLSAFDIETSGFMIQLGLGTAR